MIKTTQMHSVIDSIRAKKGYPQKHQQGAVMINTVVETYPSLEGINVYYPKNKNHFWLGVVQKHHATLHHGFDLEKYESQEEWEQDVKQVMPEGTIGEESEFMETTPHFFASNLPDEDYYYFVVARFAPSQKMKEFRQNLLKTFPHTSAFPTWEPHVGIASVADEKSRDELMERIKGMKVRLGDLYIGFTKNK